MYACSKTLNGTATMKAPTNSLNHEFAISMSPLGWRARFHFDLAGLTFVKLPKPLVLQNDTLEAGLPVGPGLLLSRGK